MNTIINAKCSTHPRITAQFSVHQSCHRQASPDISWMASNASSSRLQFGTVQGVIQIERRSRLATLGSRNARTTRCTSPRIRPGERDREAPFVPFRRIDFEIIVAVNRKNSPSLILSPRLPSSANRAPHLRPGGVASR